MAELVAGSRLADYEIDDVIGRGGMSVVYRARQVALDRVVALKVLAAELADDPSFRERFVRESRLIAATEHPNIIPIYDAGESDGVVYLTMRYVDGSDLQSLVAEKGPLPAPSAVRVVAAIGAALDAAHARELIHRDVKPSNVLLEQRGAREHVYLTDFGVAKQARSRGLTRTGQFVGTLDYIAPEQLTGKAPDAHADIYALGCVLFYALTGRVPFPAETDARILFAHLEEPPPRPSELVSGLPSALDTVIARAMAKEPDDRYASAGELGRAALAAATTLPDPTSVPTAPAPAVPPATPRPTSRSEPREDRSEPGHEEVGSTGVSSRPPTIITPAPAPIPEVGYPLVQFRLNESFRYVHEPLTAEHGVPFIGNKRIVDALKERISHSGGGSFLVTGFRGVGKTTVIRRALEELDNEVGNGTRVVPILLNVARPMTTDELLFEVVRRLFETLVDEGFLDRLTPQVQRALLIAYSRTSLAFKETRANAVERSRSLEIGAGALTGPALGKLTPSLGFSKKTTKSLATEAAFLAYTDADVEHDFLRIVSLVRRGPPPAVIRPRWRFWSRSSPTGERSIGQLIVVIDELDKLTVREDGLKCVEEILTGLKNLLTTPGVHFLFVAGPDLHDRALSESHRGNSVYESVFGWQLYVPCVWDAPGKLLDALVDPADQKNEWFALLRDYLVFKARGIPRLMLIELNSLAAWEEDQPRVILDSATIARVQFYASLQRILTNFLQQSDQNRGAFAIPIDEDRWRLGAYYVTDWILRRKGVEFTVEDITGAHPTVDPTLVLAPGKVEQLIDHLVANEVVEQVRGRADQAYLSDAPSAQKAAYTVRETIYSRLLGLQHANERERAELSSPSSDGAPSAQPWEDTTAFGTVSAGRYELVRELDRGGIASVYQARDRVLSRDVAIKILENPSLVQIPSVRARFQRHSSIASSLIHPNIVPTYDTFAEEDGRLGIVMQLVDGVSVRDMLTWARMPAEEAVRLGLELLDALEYLNEQGVARLDLKPSNVMLAKERKPVIVDLGLAKVIETTEQASVTTVGALVGTPAYLSPEQAQGREVDIRTDLYALALLLYEMITGRPARRGDEIGVVIEQARNASIDLTGLQTSAGLQKVLERALAPNPDDRYASPSEMRHALQETPEASTGLQEAS